MSRSLVRASAKDKTRLQRAYRNLQGFYKYGNHDALKELDLETVQELFSASQKAGKKQKDNTVQSGETSGTPDAIAITPTSGVRANSF